MRTLTRAEMEALTEPIPMLISPQALRIITEKPWVRDDGERFEVTLEEWDDGQYSLTFRSVPVEGQAEIAQIYSAWDETEKRAAWGDK